MFTIHIKKHKICEQTRQVDFRGFGGKILKKTPQKLCT